MANEIKPFDAGETGRTVYAVEFSAAGLAWDGTADATYTTTRDTFDRPLAEIGTTGLYGPLSFAGGGAGRWYQVFLQSGALPSHADDILLGVGSDVAEPGDAMALTSGERTTLSTAVRTELATELARIDAAITSRLAPSSPGETLDIFNGAVESVNELSGSVAVASIIDGAIVGSTLGASAVSTIQSGLASQASVDTVSTAATAAQTAAESADAKLGTPAATIAEDIANIEGGGGGGPLEHTRVPASRTYQVRGRADGKFGIVGQIRLKPGESLWHAVEFKGTQLAAGVLLDAMAAPVPAGAAAANLTIAEYGVFGTQAKFRPVLDAAAAALDEIEIDFSVTPTTGETLKVTALVTVKDG